MNPHVVAVRPTRHLLLAGMSIVAVVLAAALLLLLQDTAQGEEEGFENRDRFYFGAQQRQTKILAVGDLDGDGALDIVAGYDQGYVYKNRNDGTGRMHLGTPLTLAVGMAKASVTGFALGDLNGDGALDIVEINGAQPTVVYFNQNNGSGGFERGQSLQELADEGGDTRGVAIADINSDGLLDIIVASYDQRVIIYTNTPAGIVHAAPETVSVSLAQGTTSLAVGDVNEDGLPDIVIGHETLYPEIYINDEDAPGQFIPQEPLADLSWILPIIEHKDYFPGIDLDVSQSKTAQVTLGDMNGDGKLDIVLSTLIASTPYNRPPEFVNYVLAIPVVVYPNSSGESESASFGAPLPILDRIFTPGPPNGSSVHALGDVNGDHALDIAYGYYSKDAQGLLDTARKVYVNQTKGFSPEFARYASLFDILTEYKTTNVAIADLNGDGVLDLVFGNDGNAGLVFLNNRSESFGLYNGFGKGVALSRGDSLFRSQTTAIAVGDMDGDGLLDLVQGNYDDPLTIFYNTGAGHFNHIRELPLSAGTKTIALGALNDDEQLDIVVGKESDSIVLFLSNPDGGYATKEFTETHATTSVAVGDLTRNGRLDLVVGISGTSLVYLNEGGGEFVQGPPLPEAYETRSIALGDINGDGFLDIVTGNDGSIAVFLNAAAGGRFEPGPTIVGSFDVRSVAVGDVNGDGALDIVAGNNGVSFVYLNDRKGGFVEGVPLQGAYTTHSVALGDVNGDGALDIVAAGVSALEVLIYINRNDGSGNFDLDLGLERSFPSRSVALGDVTGDGALDIVMSGGGAGRFPTMIYRNTGQGAHSLVSPIVFGTTDDGVWTHIYTSDSFTRPLHILPNNPPRLRVIRPGRGADANFFSTPFLIEEPSGIIPITYYLFDEESDPVGRIEVEYSLDGGGQWRKATSIDTQLTNLSTSPYPTPTASNTHVFKWNTLGSANDFGAGFFGQSDNVALRIRAYPQTITNIQATDDRFMYKDSVAGPYQWPDAAATTFPFRARGTVIQVFTETIASVLADALVYRHTPTDTLGARPIVNPFTDRPWRTDPLGYLPGRGAINRGDQLVALRPITTTDLITFVQPLTLTDPRPVTFTERISLYHTNAPVTITGTQLFTVTTPGVQQLIVSADNKLMLLNLDISLEWDARRDQAYLDQLASDLQRTSEILYDVTNGQVALGQIRVYQAREQWLESNIQIYARNDLRPNANLGGIAAIPLTDTLATREPITNAVLPGHIRMGATWNRFGNPSGVVGEDWPRALVHELGHYAFFLLDNYLGLDKEKGALIEVDCKGSIMTDAYRPEYSEFLAPGAPPSNGFSWDTNECKKTLAALTTGRSDWETVTRFYPFLNPNLAAADGPSRLPLAVTKVTFITPTVADNTFAAPFVYLTGSETPGSPEAPLALRRGEAQAYLFKANDPYDPEDDVVIAAGSPNGPLIQARGAAPGDRFCVFNTKRDGGRADRIGCIDPLSSVTSTLPLRAIEGWHPQITVRPVNSTTLAITVTVDLTTSQLISDGIDARRIISLQVYPADRSYSLVKAPRLQMTRSVTNSHQFTAYVEFPLTVFHGHARVVVQNDPAQREAMTEFFVSPGWNGNKIAYFDGNKIGYFDGNRSAYFDAALTRSFSAGMNSWSAPTTSAEGQIAIFSTDNPLRGNVASVLQSLTVPPALPPWLTPVGQIFRYDTDGAPPDKTVIQFQYLQRELPEVSERHLRVYFLSLKDLAIGNLWHWQRLDNTVLDSARNIASAPMQGPGLYALMATIPMPPLRMGWQSIAYPDTGPEPRPVGQALASLGAAYTSVYYHYLDGDTWRWKLYDTTVRPEFAPMVNDLRALKPLHSYEIYALQVVTPYIGIPSTEHQMLPSAAALQPPATFYGMIDARYRPRNETQVVAWIGAVECGRATVIDPRAPREPNIALPLSGVNRVFLPLVDLARSLPYKIQVRADNGDQCGAFGREVVFTVDGQTIPNTHIWDNSHACYHPLGGAPANKFACLGDLAPDLVVTSLTASATDVRIIIKNVGRTAVPIGNGFWVDLYINPTCEPQDIKVNDTWPKISPEGLVWGVTDLALPFEPGAEIVLTRSSQYFRPDVSSDLGKSPVGTAIFADGDNLIAHVDSTNANNDEYGAVLESHEILYGRENYNNVSFKVTVKGSSALVAEGDVRVQSGQEMAERSETLPPR